MLNILKEIHSVRSVKRGEAALRENTRHRSPATSSNLPLNALYRNLISLVIFAFCDLPYFLWLNHRKPGLCLNILCVLILGVP